MKQNTHQFHWAKLMHHFDRVELITFQSTGKTCTRSVWGQEESDNLPCQADQLMLVALQEDHSFIYIKSGEIRLVKAWLKDGRLISDYMEFIFLLQLSLKVRNPLVHVQHGDCDKEEAHRQEGKERRPGDVLCEQCHH